MCDWKWITVLEGETHTLDQGISRGEARLTFPGAHASAPEVKQNSVSGCYMVP